MTTNTIRVAAMAACMASLAVIAVPAGAATLPGTASAHVGLATASHGTGALLRTGGERAAAGIGALIIGGVILSEAARAEHRRDHGGDWDRCARSYRSFDRDTGFYSGRDGERRQCQYLR